MIRVTVSYVRPKNIEIEMAILNCLSPFHGSKLGEFGFIDNRFEVLVGFKKQSQAEFFEKEVLKLNNKFFGAKIVVSIAKIKDSLPD